MWPTPRFAMQTQRNHLGQDLPCWSGSALRDTMALMAGKVMLDIAATAPAAHIILRATTVVSSQWKRFSSIQTFGAHLKVHNLQIKISHSQPCYKTLTNYFKIFKVMKITVYVSRQNMFISNIKFGSDSSGYTAIWRFVTVLQQEVSACRLWCRPERCVIMTGFIFSGEEAFRVRNFTKNKDESSTRDSGQSYDDTGRWQQLRWQDCVLLETKTNNSEIFQCRQYIA